jgi:hypothetical protein
MIQSERSAPTSRIAERYVYLATVCIDACASYDVDGIPPTATMTGSTTHVLHALIFVMSPDSLSEAFQSIRSALILDRSRTES